MGKKNVLNRLRARQNGATGTIVQQENEEDKKKSQAELDAVRSRQNGSMGQQAQQQVGTTEQQPAPTKKLQEPAINETPGVEAMRARQTGGMGQYAQGQIGANEKNFTQSAEPVVEPQPMQKIETPQATPVMAKDGEDPLKRTHAPITAEPQAPVIEKPVQEKKPIEKSVPDLKADIKTAEQIQAEHEDDALKAELIKEYGDSMRQIVNDPDTWNRYKPILKGQWQDLLDSKRKQPTEKQKRATELYHLLNKATAGLSQLGQAIGMSKTATSGPVGGAVEPHDLYSGTVKAADDAKKRYDDAAKEFKAARDKLGDTIFKANSYQYQNKKEREALDREQQKYEEKMAFEYAKFSADNARKDREAEARLKKLAADIELAHARTNKTKTDQAKSKKESYVYLKVGVNKEGNDGFDIPIPKDKWTPENIAQAYMMLSDRAKREVQQFVDRNKSARSRFGMGVDVNVRNEENLAMMRMAIGQHLTEDDCSKAYNFVVSLLEDNSIPKERKNDNTREGKPNSKNIPE